MGQFSVEKPVLPGSVLSGNQHSKCTPLPLFAWAEAAQKPNGYCPRALPCRFGCLTTLWSPPGPRSRGGGSCRLLEWRPATMPEIRSIACRLGPLARPSCRRLERNWDRPRRRRTGTGDAGPGVVFSDGLLTDRDLNAASGAPIQIDGTDVRARAAPRGQRDHRHSNNERPSHATPHFVFLTPKFRSKSD